MNMILYVVKTSPGNYDVDVVPDVIFKNRVKELIFKGHSSIWRCELEHVELKDVLKGKIE